MNTGTPHGTLNDQKRREQSDPSGLAPWMRSDLVMTDLLGTSGLRHAGGFLDEEFLGRLKYQQGVRFYREMWDSSAVVGAIMGIIMAVIRQCPWTVEASDDTSAAKAEQEFVESCMQDMEHSWGGFISEVITMLVFGWSWFEVTMKVRKGEHLDDKQIDSRHNDGRFGIRSLAIRSQDTLWQWALTRAGDLLGMIQLDPYNLLGRGPVYLPLEKSLHFTTRSYKQSPEGFSLLRPVVRSYHIVKRLEEIEATGMDRELTGMPILQVPKELLMVDASASEKQLASTLQTMIQQIRTDERWGGLIPAEFNPDGTKSGFKLEAFNSGGRRAIDSSGAIMRYNTQIMQAFAADFIQVGQNKVGTQSLFEGKSNLFLLGLTHYLDLIAEELNRKLVPMLMRQNGVGRDLWPRFDHGKLDKPDLDSMGTFLQKLGAAGLLSPNRKLEDRVLEIADLPAPEDDDRAVFEDLTRPTPANAADRATNLLSDEQAKAIMDVNEKVNSGKMSVAVAAKLLAARLGMDAQHAMEFVEETKKESEPGGDEGVSSLKNPLETLETVPEV